MLITRTKHVKPIGVFDSGVGGLSVLRHLVRLMPNEHFVYLGDTARVPYGNKSPETVQHYSRQCTHFLLERGVKTIVVACNTASALALKEVEQISEIPVSGVILPAAEAALRATKNGKIGVIGTRATIGSKAHADVIYRIRKKIFPEKEIEVFGQACPLFVPLVEEGLSNHPATRLIAEEYLAPLKEKNIDTLILGCTHYPALTPLLQELMPGVTLIDSGEATALVIQKILQERGELEAEQSDESGETKISFYATDIPPTFFDVAEEILGFEAEKVQRVNIEHYEEYPAD